MMREGTDEQKLTAAMEVAHFNFVYNEEYNLLLNLEAATKIAHYKATHTDGGINHGYRLELEALCTQISARKSFLDMKMTAFHEGKIGIDAPDQKLVETVKKLTDKVSKMVLKDQAIGGIIKSLTEVAHLVNGTMDSPV